MDLFLNHLFMLILLKKVNMIDNAYYNSGNYNVYYGNKLVATIKDHNGGQGWGTITYDQGLYHSSNVAICNLLDQGYVTKRCFNREIK